MKRIFILVTIVLFAAGAAFADEAILIDFTKLAADIHVDIGDQSEGNNQNRQTLMDFASAAGGSFTAAQKSLLKVSLAPNNWNVVLASSARNVVNQSGTYAKEAKSTEHGQVLGVRVHFPVEPFNSWARINPPFIVPSYDFQEVGEDGSFTQGQRAALSRFEGPAPADGELKGGYGLIKNVGTIKSVAVRVYGLNFPHSFSAILVNDDGSEQVVSLGNLNYDGWRELVWNNPAYVTQARNREIRLYPLYPVTPPALRFGGFLVQRDADKEGGDFITYIRDVKVVYDKAVLDTERDIDDETEWGIIDTREKAATQAEVRRFGHNQLLRYLENQKIAPEAPFGDPSRQTTTQ